MEIKGNIGEEVYVKAKIKSISVDQDGTRYFLDVEYEDTKGVNSSDILFNAEPEEAPQEVPEEVVEEVVETPPKPGLYEWTDIETPTTIKLLEYTANGSIYLGRLAMGRFRACWWREVKTCL